MVIATFVTPPVECFDFFNMLHTEIIPSDVLKEIFLGPQHYWGRNGADILRFISNELYENESVAALQLTSEFLLDCPNEDPTTILANLENRFIAAANPTYPYHPKTLDVFINEKEILYSGVEKGIFITLHSYLLEELIS
jgi:hypothetical protein